MADDSSAATTDAGAGPATRLAELTTRDAEETTRRILLVPLGATEQHGPHLTLDTDTVIAMAWADAAAARIPALVAPALPYGSSGEHQSFAGTLSIGAPVLELVLVELARSARDRFDRIVFVAGHAGNANGPGPSRVPAPIRGPRRPLGRPTARRGRCPRRTRPRRP